jgi:hypothetical protein
MAFRRCAWQALTPPHDVGLVATLAKVYPEAKACCFRLSSLPCGMSHLARAEREGLQERCAFSSDHFTSNCRHGLVAL